MRLEGVLGQDRALGRIEADLNQGRLAHAYLFVGPDGCGRGSAAGALFRALNCQDPGETACGVCPSCRRALAWQHENLAILAPPAGGPSAQIKVDEVREVIRSLGFAPLGGGVRLILIRRAEALNPASANALLKTLEEPPPANVLVLTCQDPRGLLPTLVSRCRKVGFRPLPLELIAGELTRRGEDPGAAALKAGLAGGSLGRALDLDHRVWSERLAALTGRLAAPGSPLDHWQFADDLVGQFRAAGGLDRQGLVQTLELLILAARDAAVAAAGRPALANLAGRAPAMGLAAATGAFSLVRRAQAAILGNASPELTITVLLGDLAALGA